MEVIWNEKDIEGGRRTFNPRNNERFMIGYWVGQTGNVPCLISLNDGMVIHYQTKHELALALTNNKDFPVELEGFPKTTRGDQT